MSSERLWLRKLTEEDAIHFFNINSEPDCIAYTGDRPFEDLESAHTFISDYIRQYDDYGMGRWAVCLNDSNDFIGWCGLKYHKKEDLVDVGYRFYKEHWGKGYATEATRACLEYGFTQLRLHRIVAHIHVDNLASHRVIIKAGLNYLNDFMYDGQPAKLYEIKKIDYLGNE